MKVEMLEWLLSFNWDQVSSQLQCTDPWYWTENIKCLIFRSACSRIGYLSNNTSWYIMVRRTIFIELRTRYLPPTYSTQMADQYEIYPEEYVYDLRILSYYRYSQGMLSPIPSFSKQQLQHFQAIVAPLMVYGFIDHIPQQVRLSICKQWFHITLLS